MQLVLGVFLACFTILIAQTLIRYYWILPTFETMAEEGDRDDLERVASQVTQELQAMHKLVYDSALWDAMYDTVSNNDSTWFRENFLSYESLTRIDIDGWYLFADNGQLISGASYDDTGTTIEPEGLSSLQALFGRSQVSLAAGENSLFTLIDKQPAVVVYHQVLPSDGSGKPNGTLLIWRKIDESFVDTLTPGINDDIALHTISNIPFQSDAIAMFYGQQSARTSNVFNGRLYLSFNSETGIPLFALSVIPRQRQYNTSLFDASLLVGLVITLSVIVLFYIWIKQQLILPISRIHENVSYAMRHRDFSLRDNFVGRNEAFRLGRKLNEMFVLIDHQRNEVLLHNQQLEKLTNTDPLTGLSNRRHLDRYLQNLPLDRRNGRHPLTILIADVDYFKRFNDHYGHAEGDKALMQVASLFRNSTRADTDLVARYGGEEFLIVLQEASASAALKVAQNLLVQVRQAAIPHAAREDHKSYLTISLGIACLRVGSLDQAEFLIRQADKALYKAKSSGRDCYVLSDTEYSAGVSKRILTAE